MLIVNHVMGVGGVWNIYVLNRLLQFGKKVESSGLDFKKLNKQGNKKHVEKTSWSVVFLADFHICHRHRGKGEGLCQGPLSLILQVISQVV